MKKTAIFFFMLVSLNSLSSQENYLISNSAADAGLRSSAKGLGSGAIVNKPLTFNYEKNFTGGAQIHSDLYAWGSVSGTTIAATNISDNQTKSILAKLSEGNNLGEGTSLRVKAYTTQKVYEDQNPNDVKSFSLEHIFYGELNNSINFYRGLGVQGGSVGISVYDGNEVCRFRNDGISVKGIIRAEEIRIETADWADYVFDKDYKLPSLYEVKAHIDEHKHLPGIPSEAEVKENGVNLVEMQIKLLQKIEELTLYVIAQEKENQEQKMRIEELEKNFK